MLPNSPSDCQAPFTSPVAKHLWSGDISLSAVSSAIDENPYQKDTAWRKQFDRDYALAQQAEFERSRLERIVRTCPLFVKQLDPDFHELIDRTEEYLDSLNPPTP